MRRRSSGAGVLSMALSGMAVQTGLALMTMAQTGNATRKRISIAAAVRKRGCRDPRKDPMASSSRLVAAVF
jgi:hypothetical protein